MSYMIAVHLGAGPPCSAEKKLVYKQMCEVACKSALNLLKTGSSSVDAACEAVRLLEDNPHTNAGTGANLTLCGRVECDASVMDGITRNFGSVGAVSDLKNPILVAKRLLEQQNLGLLSLGRIPPCMLVAGGAKHWALEQGFKVVPEGSLSTEKAHRVHKKHKLKIESIEKLKKIKIDSSNRLSSCFSDQPVSMDTIGAVCIDRNGTVASAVSSGGLIMKHSGRIGQAAVFGAGCWAENRSSLTTETASPRKHHELQFTTSDNSSSFSSDESPPARNTSSIAIATTGIGENLMKTVFAKECAHSLKNNDDPHQALKDVFDSEFLKSPFLKSHHEKLAGALVLKADGHATELLVAHTTSSMFFGFGHQQSTKIKVILSSLPAGTIPGTAVQIQAFAIKS